MPIRCPYCCNCSVDRHAHKLHLRVAHSSQHSRCVSRAIQGGRTEWRQIGPVVDQDAVGVTFCGISYTIPRNVAEQVFGLITEHQLNSGPQSPISVEASEVGISESYSQGTI